MGDTDLTSWLRQPELISLKKAMPYLKSTFSDRLHRGMKFVLEESGFRIISASLEANLRGIDHAGGWADAAGAGMLWQGSMARLAGAVNHT